MSERLRVLHLQADSAIAARLVRLINAFGRPCEHAIVLAEPDAPDRARGIDRGIVVDWAADFPALPGRPTPGRLQRLARAMQGHDLVLTYGYGAMAAVLAHTVFGGYLPLPPLVHHEDEAGPLNLTRNWYRRIALGRAAALVVPSRRLEAIAVDSWHQPAARVKRIAPGIRTSMYAAKPRRDALPRIIKRDGELWLGTLAELIPANDPGGLVRAFSALPEPWQLVILGDGPHRDAIRDAALRLDLGHRVHFAGAVAELAPALALFDLFASAAGGDSATPAIIQAMATGLAVVATDKGEVAALLASENRPYLPAPGDQPGFTAALQALAAAPALRNAIGAANRARARAEFDEARMIAAYRAVYGAALRRPAFP